MTPPSTTTDRRRRVGRPAWTRSVRFRLTFRFTGIFAALLVIGAVAFIATIQVGMLSDTAFFLARKSRRIEKLVHDAGSASAASTSAMEDHDVTILTSRFPGLLWFDTVYTRLIDDKSRQVLLQSPSLATQVNLTTALNAQLGRSPTGRQPVFAFDRPRNSRPVRICTTLNVIRGKPYIIQVAVPWESQEYRLNGLESVFAASIGVVLLLGAMGGWFLVGRSLQPIDRIVTTAEQVDAESLGADLLLAQNESDSEIARLVDTLNRMARRLHEAFLAQQRYADAQRRFAADASHELRTPLTVLRTEIEVSLLKPRIAEDYRRSLQAAAGEIDRMSRLVESLMFLARNDIQRIDQTSTDSRLDASAIVSAVIDDFEEPARGRGISLTYNAGGLSRPLIVRGEPEQLRLMLRNLLENALKYSTDGGSVTITTGVSTIGDVELATIQVSDKGIGIAEDELPHVFERFWRSDQARSRSGRGDSGEPDASGSGLGLSIVRQIAIAHGGEVRVSSELGHGSTFSVDIPLAPPSNDDVTA